ncbi:MAG: hypothetical protein MUF87_16330 [Anaerolineae bacterium]|jgi:hypothetical protein|nr:hypothetical protein [Anaerolineae bacterium]
MKFTPSEQEAIDRYFDALLTDPNAPPPQGVTPNEAALMRELIKTKPRINDQQADRVWTRVLFATFAPNDLHPIYRSEDTTAPQQTKKRYQPWLFLLAAVFAGVFLSGVLIPATTQSARAIPSIHYPAPDHGFATHGFESGNYYPVVYTDRVSYVYLYTTP